MKAILLIVVVAGALALVGCAAPKHDHSAGHGGAGGGMMEVGLMTGMGKSQCKMMVADATSPMKCKMCGGDAASHNHGPTAESAKEPATHQH